MGSVEDAIRKLKEAKQIVTALEETSGVAKDDPLNVGLSQIEDLINEALGDLISIRNPKSVGETSP